MKILNFKLYIMIRKLLFNNIYLLLGIVFFYSNIVCANGDDSLPTRIKEVKTLIANGEYQDAVKIMDELYLKYPDSLSVLLDRAVCNLYIGRADVAKLMMNKYLDKDTTNYDTYNVKGAACENLGELDSALTNYNIAIKMNNKIPDAYYNRGKVYFSQHKYSEALNDLIKAKQNCSKGTNNNNIIMLLAQTYVAVHQYDKALKEFKIIEKKNPDNIFITQNMADAYFLNKNYKMAIEYYTKALNIDSNNVNMLNNRAICYNEIRESEKAELDQEKIETIQRQQGVQIQLLKYKDIVAEDDAFKFKIPNNWRAFSSDMKDSVIIVFFNPEFKNIVNSDTIDYNFGGELKIIKSNLITDADLNNIINQRAAISDNYVLNREIETSNYRYYKNIMKKLYNPTASLHQGLMKAEYNNFSDDPSDNRFILEYHCVNNKGWLATLYIWVPIDEAFYYEKLLDYILSTLSINIQ